MLNRTKHEFDRGLFNHSRLEAAIETPSDGRHVWWKAVLAVFCLLAVMTIVILLIQRKKFLIKNCCVDKERESTSGGVQLLGVISRGNFSLVYYGRYKSSTAAIKVVQSADYSQFECEKTILREHANHPNITLHLGDEILKLGRNNNKYFCLITEYAPEGSLRRYLQKSNLPLKQCLHLMKTLSFGVSYLHGNELYNGGYKHITAHRDLKSTNVLVSPTRGCIITDFGLAVKVADKNDEFSPKDIIQIGTPRYMSPEKLLCHCKNSDFQTFLTKCDVYAMSLILYEIACCSSFPDMKGELIEGEYKLPYFSLVGCRPSVKDMKGIVCFKNIRPEVSKMWKEHLMMNGIRKAIEKSWQHNADTRPSAIQLYSTFLCLEIMLEKYATTHKKTSHSSPGES